LAPEDLAARVALHLVPAAQPEVAAHRYEPAAEPVGVGERVPDVLDRGVVRPSQVCGPRLARAGVAGADRAVDGLDLARDIHHFSVFFRRSRLPRASSVASASRCGVQYRRKRASHMSTSWRGAESTA